MLWFERQLVASITATGDHGARASVEAFVDGTLRSMPEHLRAGIGVVSVAFGALRLRGDRAGGLSPRVVRLLEEGPLPPLRQYVRLFRSLVLFAEQELVPGPAR